jgi:hypothetical protein
LNIEKNIKVSKEDWIKFKSTNRQIFIGSWKQEKFIREEEANNLKDLDAFMGKIFIKGEERIRMRQIIEKYQTWLELAADGYEIKKETWKILRFEKEDREVKDWHTMKTLEFPQVKFQN